MYNLYDVIIIKINKQVLLFNKLQLFKKETVRYTDYVDYHEVL